MGLNKVIFLVAGGTGGHVFPARALGEALERGEYKIEFVTDKRGIAYFSDDVDAAKVHRLSASTLFAGALWTRPFKVFNLLWGILQALWLILRRKPIGIVGFGGYPSFAPCLVGLLLRRPVLVHEQNAVLGRANKWLVRLGAELAISHQHMFDLPSYIEKRARYTGNPLRRDVHGIASKAYAPPTAKKNFQLLIMGGSQGARIFSEIMPRAIQALPKHLRSRLYVAHQSDNAAMCDILRIYAKAGVQAEIRTFFDDLPMRMRTAHLAISRAGASSIGELTVMGLPSILVPLPGALDQDQAANARMLAKKHAAILIPQKYLSVERVSALLQHLMETPQKLKMMSEARLLLKPQDSAHRLACYIICLIRHEPVKLETVTHKKNTKQVTA